MGAGEGAHPGAVGQDDGARLQVPGGALGDEDVSSPFDRRDGRLLENLAASPAQAVGERRHIARGCEVLLPAEPYSHLEDVPRYVRLNLSHLVTSWQLDAHLLADSMTS